MMLPGKVFIIFYRVVLFYNMYSNHSWLQNAQLMLISFCVLWTDWWKVSHDFKTKLWKEAILGYNTSQHDTCEKMLLVKKIELVGDMLSTCSNLRVAQNGRFAINPVYPRGNTMVTTRMKIFGLQALWKLKKCTLQDLLLS